MIGNLPDGRADRIGRMAATVFLAGLFVMFAYGYLVPILFG